MATLHLHILTKCLFCAFLTFKYIHFAQHTMTSCAPSNRQKDQTGLVQDLSLSKPKKSRTRTNASPTRVGPGLQSGPVQPSPRTGLSNTRHPCSSSRLLWCSALHRYVFFFSFSLLTISTDPLHTHSHLHTPTPAQHDHPCRLYVFILFSLITMVSSPLHTPYSAAASTIACTHTA